MTEVARVEPGQVHLPGCVLTTTGLRITDPNMPPEQAGGIGFVLGKMHASVRFAIGDWLLYIEDQFPQEWSQLAEELNLSEESKKEYMRVSQRVPRSTRRPKLDWSLHRAVAALPPPDQKEWLKRAEDEHLSHHAMRAALRNGKPPAPVHVCRCCGRPLTAAD